MTLPGVNRALAQSITAHRRKIRSFRRVEDLALVTGVGAEHMLKLRPEITVREIPPQQAVTEGETCCSAGKGSCDYRNGMSHCLRRRSARYLGS